MWWRYLIICLACLLIGAHFLRFNQLIFCGLSVIAPVLLMIRHKISFAILKYGLVVAAFGIWGLSSYQFISFRIEADQPWIRLALIMVTVILFTLWAAWQVQVIGEKKLTLIDRKAAQHD